MPHTASHINSGAYVGRTKPVISTEGPMHAADIQPYPWGGLCMPHGAGQGHSGACACRAEWVISTEGLCMPQRASYSTVYGHESPLRGTLSVPLISPGGLGCSHRARGVGVRGSVPVGVPIPLGLWCSRRSGGTQVGCPYPCTAANHGDSGHRV